MNGTTSNVGINGWTEEHCEKSCYITSERETSIEDFLNSVFKLSIDEVLKKGKDRNEPVIRYKSPDELNNILDLEIEDQSQSHKQLFEQCRKIIQYSVKTGHPHFFNQLYGGLDPYGFAGQVITDVLNTSMYTYEVAPVFVLAEQALLKQFRNIIGYTEGDGTFPPGGSYSNMLGMNLARFHKFPDVKEKGLKRLPTMVVFASDQCHYSILKNASVVGLGSDNVIRVRCDARGKMDPEDLERRVVEARKQDAVPFIVIATAGTTVLGAYDDLDKIANVCERHKMWLHVDAAWGGGAMLSDKHKHLCKGIHRSDSVGCNPHKMMMAPLQCCVFVTRHPAIMKDCHSMNVPYLFQKDKTLYSPSYDVGSKVIQCGRKVDGLKLWLMWKARGNNGIRDRIEKAFDNSRYLTELVRKTEGFKLVTEPECTNVCFWYIPETLRDIKWNTSDQEFSRKLSAVAPAIKRKMTEKGSMLIGYQPLGDLPNFFRMVVINDDVTHGDMDFVVAEIEKLGSKL